MNISVMPKDENGRIPISLAGSVLVCIQDILYGIGEYLVMKELKLQNHTDARLRDMFRLYVDPASGVSMGTSSSNSSGIVEDALALMERTLIGIGSGAGGYWIDDTFTDPRSRRIIVQDVMRLAGILNGNEQFFLRFSADSMFDNVDAEKLEQYLERMQMSADGATCGVVRTVSSRSGRSDGIRIDIGGERIKASFLTPDAESGAALFDGRPVIAAGRIKFSNGRISEITDIGKIVPLETMMFRRIISSDGDLSLAEPLTVSVEYDAEKEEWTLSNDELGVSVHKGTWDEAMVSFHDYFIFLYSTYRDPKKQLSDEEIEMRDRLMTLVMPE